MNWLSESWGRHLEDTAKAVVIRAYEEATPITWDREAARFRWALPRPTDFLGQSTLPQRAERTVRTLRRIYTAEIRAANLRDISTLAEVDLQRLQSFETFASAELRRLWRVAGSTEAYCNELRAVGRLVGLWQQTEAAA